MFDPETLSTKPLQVISSPAEQVINADAVPVIISHLAVSTATVPLAISSVPLNI